MLEMRLISEKGLREVHGLMLAQGFPDTPKHFVEAEIQMRRAYKLGAFCAGELQAAFIFGDVTADAAYLDVVCAASVKGKWANRRVLKEIYKVAFVALGLKFIWAEARNKCALTACLTAGFVPANALTAASNVLILTKTTAAQKLKISDTEHAEMKRVVEEEMAL